MITSISLNFIIELTDGEGKTRELAEKTCFKQSLTNENATLEAVYTELGGSRAH